jgi:pimeloyl-ACP methyl ester carboxylesterase
VVDGAGHMVILERPEVVNDVLSELLMAVMPDRE